MSSLVGFVQDVWTGATGTWATDHASKRVAVAGVAAPLVNFGLNYLGKGLVQGLIPGEAIPQEINAGLTLGGVALVGWAAIETVRAVGVGVGNLVRRVGEAREIRQLAGNQKQFLKEVEKELAKIDQEIRAQGNQPRTELGNLRTHLAQLQTDLRAGARTPAQLAADADTFSRCKRAHALLLEIWEPLLAQNLAAAGHALRGELTARIPAHGTALDDARLTALTVLKRQLALRPQVLREMADLQTKIDAAAANPAQNPHVEYTNLRTHFAQLDTQLQAVRTAAELDTADADVARWTQVKAIIPEIWSKLQAQNKVGADALRARLTALVPAQATGPIDAAALTNLNLLKEQLTLRQSAVDKVKEVTNIKGWQDLLAQLQTIPAAQAAIAAKQDELNQKQAQVLAKRAEVDAASPDKPYKYFGDSPKVLRQKELTVLQTQAASLQGELEGLKHLLAQQPYLQQANIQTTLALLLAQPASAERDQHIVALQRLDVIRAQIAALAPNNPGIVPLEAQMQADPHLEAASLNALIQRTQAQVDRLPKPADTGTVLAGFTGVQTALNAVVDVPALQAQRVAFDAAVGQIPNPVVIAPAALPPAAPPPAVLPPAVVPPAVPPAAEHSWTSKGSLLTGAGLVGFGAIAWATCGLLPTALAATAVVADHFKGKQTVQRGAAYLNQRLQPAPGMPAPRPAAPVVPRVVPPAAPAPVLTGFEALGNVPVGAAHVLKKVSVINADPKKYDFSSKEIQFAAKSDAHAELAGILQGLVKAKPLMDQLAARLAKIELDEEDLFGTKGAAKIAHESFKNLTDEERAPLQPKIAAWLAIATAFQPGVPALSKENLLQHLRIVTEGNGLDVLKGMTERQKFKFYQMRVLLEAEAVVEAANRGDQVSQDDLNRLFSALAACKTPMKKEFNARALPQILRDWPEGDLRTVDVQTAARILIHCIDSDAERSKTLFGAVPNIKHEKDVLVVYGNWKPPVAGKTTVELQNNQYDVMGVVKQDGNPTTKAYVRQPGLFEGSWRSCRKNAVEQVQPLAVEVFNRGADAQFSNHVVFLVRHAAVK